MLNKLGENNHKMTRSSEHSIPELFITLMIKVFGSRYTIVIFDPIMTILISLQISNTGYIDIKLILLFLLQIAVNIGYIVAGNIDQKEKKFIYYIGEAYNIQNNINFDMAGRLFEANEIIANTINDKVIKKDSFNYLIDFRELSQNICDELYNFVKTCFNCEECEISIFQRFFDDQGDYVKMIAYKNNNKESFSPKRNFALDNTESKTYVFIKIFNDLDANTKILPNKDAVAREFSWLEGSEGREQGICQYIGVPIKTKRNRVEILLQIDVSKNNILGKNMDELNEFAENIIRPFSNLLYCSYGRELILNKFYDILIENIPREEDK